MQTNTENDSQMKNRKEIKKLGRASLKKHYAIFVAACLIAAFIGAEFAGSLSFSKAQTEEQAVQQIESDLKGEGNYQLKTDIGGATWADVLITMAEDGTEAGREMTEQTEQEEIEAAKTGNPIFGRTRGVLSGVVNQFTSGSILVTLVASVAQITGSENLGILLLIAAGALLAFAFWFLVTNVFRVAVRRVFLEGMIYDNVTSQRFTFLLRIKKWLRASWIMFVKYIFYTLWCLTIAGIAIKRYSYYLVPYIVAENPSMTARQAITLSRRMMDGHKWECFISSQRSDRTGIPRDKLPQDVPVDFTGEANAQALIDTMRKRLCRRASPETRAYAEDFKRALREVEPELSDVLVPNCVYRCGCPEMDCCGEWQRMCRETNQSIDTGSIKYRYRCYNDLFYGTE